MSFRIRPRGIRYAYDWRGAETMEDATEIWEDFTVYLGAWISPREAEQEVAPVEHLVAGYLYGFPECCIWQFVQDQVVGIKSGQVRQVGHTWLGGRYVKCWDCSPAKRIG